MDWLAVSANAGTHSRIPARMFDIPRLGRRNHAAPLPCAFHQQSLPASARAWSSHSALGRQSDMHGAGSRRSVATLFHSQGLTMPRAASRPSCRPRPAQHIRIHANHQQQGPGAVDQHARVGTHVDFLRADDGIVGSFASVTSPLAGGKRFMLERLDSRSLGLSVAAATLPDSLPGRRGNRCRPVRGWSQARCSRSARRRLANGSASTPGGGAGPHFFHAYCCGRRSARKRRSYPQKPPGVTLEYAFVVCREARPDFAASQRRCDEYV
jgi:hypothetical protein